MKTLLVLATTTVLALSLSTASASKRTAEFLLSDPYTHEGKEVTLDVAMVQPVRWISPLAGFAFFQARTLDRSEGKSGGGILVAVPASESAAFAKKYVSNFEGRNQSRTLRGSLVAVGKNSKENSVGRRGIWVIDTTGKLLSEIETAKAKMPEEAFAPIIDNPGPGSRGPRGRR